GVPRFPASGLVSLWFGSFVPEYDHFVEWAIRFWERHDGDVFVERREVLASVGVFFDNILGTNQSDHAARHQPFRRSPQKLLFDPATPVAVVERRVQPDEGEAV